MTASTGGMGWAVCRATGGRPGASKRTSRADGATGTVDRVPAAEAWAHRKGTAVGLARARLRTAAISAVLCGVAAVTAASTMTGCASQVVHQPAPAAVATANPVGFPAVIDCLNRAQVRPSMFVLTCADGWDYLYRLHWVSWASAAFGSGIEWQKDCVPYCGANRKFYTWPVLVVLWRPEPLPHHPGMHYFTRLTEIYTGMLPRYQCLHCGNYPQTLTWDLWSKT